MQLDWGIATATTTALNRSDEEDHTHLEIVGKPPLPVPLTSTDLARRPQREADYRRENEALLRLTDALADRAANILDVLCDCAMSVCEAGSAGISLIQPDAHGQPNSFLWAAVRGEWAAYAGGGMPGDASPCGYVIALNDAVAFEDPEIAFPAAAGIEPKIHEVLLAPFHSQDKPIGTVWVLSHSPGRRFDLEDRRRLISIARFASAAYQTRQAEQELRDAQLTNAQIVGSAEHVARASAQQFRALAQLLPNHVWTAQPDGRIDWISDQVYVYTNMATGTLERDSWTTAIHPDDSSGVAAAWSNSVATGQPYEAEFRLRRGDGTYRWHICRARAFKDDDGKIVRWIGSSTDIEHQKAAAGLLSDANSVLENCVEERTRELMATEAALRQSQKMEALGQLTGGIAHDFNNLLTGIIGSLSVIDRRLKAGRNDGIEKYTGAASAAAERAAALTHRLLAFARRQPLDTKALDINGLTLGMQDILHRTLGERVDMEIHLAEDLWLALADANQFENALLNLVINSRDAMPDGGKLTIETRNVQLDLAYAQSRGDVEPGDYVAVTISDTGVGMPPDVLAHAFDPFFTTKPTGQGTGLGLSMIYGFIKQSGGHTRMYSEVGRGTSITLFLRRANVLHDASEGTSHAAVPSGHGEIVLVVEDDATVRSLMTVVLDELGYRYIEAADPRDAVNLLESDAEVDLLITDVGLPYLNGRQLAEIARVRRPQLRVLFVTGYAERAAERSGFLLPGMEMLTKPFTLDKFATTVRSLVGAR